MKYLAALLLWADRALVAATIPVENFGWRRTGTHVDGFGIAWPVGRWEWSAAEREPFHAHNRELMRLAATLRGWAVALRRL